MTDPIHAEPFYARKYYRLIAGVFGIFLVGVGAYVLLGGGTSAALRWLGGIALVLLGGNMAYSAMNSRESWISKVGPLP